MERFPPADSPPGPAVTRLDDLHPVDQRCPVHGVKGPVATPRVVGRGPVERPAKVDLSVAVRAIQFRSERTQDRFTAITPPSIDCLVDLVNDALLPQIRDVLELDIRQVHDLLKQICQDNAGRFL